MQVLKIESRISWSGLSYRPMLWTSFRITPRDLASLSRGARSPQCRDPQDNRSRYLRLEDRRWVFHGRNLGGKPWLTDRLAIAKARHLRAFDVTLSDGGIDAFQAPNDPEVTAVGPGKFRVRDRHVIWHINDVSCPSGRRLVNSITPGISISGSETLTQKWRADGTAQLEYDADHANVVDCLIALLHSSASRAQAWERAGLACRDYGIGAYGAIGGLYAVARPDSTTTPGSFAEMNLSAVRLNSLDQSVNECDGAALNVT